MESIRQEVGLVCLSEEIILQILVIIDFRNIHLLIMEHRGIVHVCLGLCIWSGQCMLMNTQGTVALICVILLLHSCTHKHTLSLTYCACSSGRVRVKKGVRKYLAKSNGKTKEM